MEVQYAAVALAMTPCAGALAQGTITYVWDVNDSGSSTGVIAPGETLNLKLYADWEPYDEVVGFARTVYEILGVEGWETGTVTLHDNKLDDLSGEGDLQASGDVLDIDSFQLPPLFNPQFWYGHPIYLYEIEWTPDDYTARTVRVADANHLMNSLYADDFGTMIEYDAAPSEGATIHIVPGPAPAFAIAGLALRRRR